MAILALVCVPISDDSGSRRSGQRNGVTAQTVDCHRGECHRRLFAGGEENVPSRVQPGFGATSRASLIRLSVTPDIAETDSKRLGCPLAGFARSCGPLPGCVREFRQKFRRTFERSELIFSLPKSTESLFCQHGAAIGFTRSFRIDRSRLSGRVRSACRRQSASSGIFFGTGLEVRPVACLRHLKRPAIEAALAGLYEEPFVGRQPALSRKYLFVRDNINCTAGFLESRIGQVPASWISNTNGRRGSFGLLR